MADNVKRALEYKAKHKCLVCETKDETKIANQELLELKCDVLVPAAIGNQIIEKKLFESKRRLSPEKQMGRLPQTVP